MCTSSSASGILEVPVDADFDLPAYEDIDRPPQRGRSVSEATPEQMVEEANKASKRLAAFCAEIGERGPPSPRAPCPDPPPCAPCPNPPSPTPTWPISARGSQVRSRAFMPCRRWYVLGDLDQRWPTQVCLLDSLAVKLD